MTNFSWQAGATTPSGLDDRAEAVLRRYPAADSGGSIESLGAAGGWSGAMFWKVRLGQRLFCLRCWPSEHPSPQQLAFIHASLLHAHSRGFDLLPVPLTVRDGDTFVVDRGRLWELAPWLPGQPHLDDPADPARVAAAFELLAQFHVAVREASPIDPAPSPSIASRLSFIDRLQQGGLAELRAAVEPCGDDLAGGILAGYAANTDRVRQRLIRLVDAPVHQQPCLRDVHREHVLFDRGAPSGLIDFGAMRFDTPTLDVARLIGSFAGDNARLRQVALDAYERRQPLGKANRTLVSVFDQSTVLLSGVNWLRWLYVEGRQFENLAKVRGRMANILARLRRLE